ncbi:hypothetical protein [Dactylosporangium salmoneum]|uniref:hypothetical protein n=1 Tax=Dactylosporangium salmoneum TaxID=53361 RepID=UPI0031DE77ED
MRPALLASIAREVAGHGGIQAVAGGGWLVSSGDAVLIRNARLRGAARLDGPLDDEPVPGQLVLF